MTEQELLQMRDLAEDGKVQFKERITDNRKLTKEEKDICNFCSVPRTAQEIMDRLGVTNQSKNRQKYITSLIEIGVLERTIPENPKDRNQKYRRKK